MAIYGIFIMAVGKAAMHRSYLYPHTSASRFPGRIFLRPAHKNKTEVSLGFRLSFKLCDSSYLRLREPFLRSVA